MAAYASLSPTRPQAPRKRDELKAFLDAARSGTSGELQGSQSVSASSLPGDSTGVHDTGFSEALGGQLSTLRPAPEGATLPSTVPLGGIHDTNYGGIHDTPYGMGYAPSLPVARPNPPPYTPAVGTPDDPLNTVLTPSPTPAPTPAPAPAPTPQQPALSPNPVGGAGGNVWSPVEGLLWGHERWHSEHPDPESHDVSPGNYSWNFYKPGMSFIDFVNAAKAGINNGFPSGYSSTLWHRLRAAYEEAIGRPLNPEEVYRAFVAPNDTDWASQLADPNNSNGFGGTFDMRRALALEAKGQYVTSQNARKYGDWSKPVAGGYDIIGKFGDDPNRYTSSTPAPPTPAPPGGTTPVPPNQPAPPGQTSPPGPGGGPTNPDEFERWRQQVLYSLQDPEFALQNALTDRGIPMYNPIVQRSVLPTARGLGSAFQIHNATRTDAGPTDNVAENFRNFLSSVLGGQNGGIQGTVRSALNTLGSSDFANKLRETFSLNQAGGQQTNPYMASLMPLLSDPEALIGTRANLALPMLGRGLSGAMAEADQFRAASGYRRMGPTDDFMKYLLGV